MEELVKAGIKDIIIVTGYHKRSIEDHFDNPSADLVNNLKNNGKEDQLKEVLKTSTLANFFYVRQKGPYGNGTPLLNVRDIIGEEPFIYTWGDDMILAKPNEFQQLIEAYQKHNCSILSGLKARGDDDFNKWAFVDADKVKLERIKRGQEFYYNDVIRLMLEDGKKIMIKEIESGEYIDTGNKFEYLKSITKFGLKNEEISNQYLAFIKSLVE